MDAAPPHVSSALAGSPPAAPDRPVPGQPGTGTDQLGTASRSTPGPARPPGGPRRMEFLDALRGIAAMSVALQHGAELLWPAYLRWSIEVFRPGEYGVFVFFLVSGFIIPASLEKRGSVRAFWVGRVLRLFPLYWAALLAIALLAVTVDRSLVTGVDRWSFANNFTMVQNFTTGGNVIGASWTLAFEMVFYLLCSALLLAGLHQRSGQIATGLLCLSVAGGVAVPSYALVNPSKQTAALALGTIAAVVGVLALSGAAKGRSAVAGIVLTAGLAVGLLLNRPESWWFALLLLGTMFTGTTVYRWYVGQGSGAQAVAVVATAIGAALVGTWVNVEDKIDPTLANAHHTWRPEFATYLAALATFGLFLALRNRRFPGWLTYLGAISYSVYLAHAIVIHVVPRVGGPVLTLAVWMAVIVATAGLSYRLIEKPFHELGRSWSSRVGRPRGATARPSAKADAVSA